MKARVHITDRAVLNYLQRGLGVDVAALRRRIARNLSPVADPADTAMDGTMDGTMDGGALIHDGLRFHLTRRTDGTLAVITITSAQTEMLSNRARRIRKKIRSCA